MGHTNQGRPTPLSSEAGGGLRSRRFDAPPDPQEAGNADRPIPSSRQRAAGDPGRGPGPALRRRHRRRRARPRHPRTGEIYGFLGPNGAGKSTTVRMLCTLSAPTAGRAAVAGHDVVARPDEVRLRIGVALQDAALDDKQTGTELLRLQGRLYGLSRARGRAAAPRPGRAHRHRRRARPPDRHLLGRHEAAPRSRRRARPQPRRAVPRRADHGPRPGEPGRGVGGGAAAQRRARA